MSYIAVASVRMNHAPRSIDPFPGGFLMVTTSPPKETREECDALISVWRMEIDSQAWTFAVCEVAPPIKTR